jgi:transposase-like protein
MGWSENWIHQVAVLASSLVAVLAGKTLDELGDADFDPDVASMLLDAGEDLLAFTDFPVAHWRTVRSTNPLERLNGEIKRRTNVVESVPNDASVLASSPP